MNASVQTQKHTWINLLWQPLLAVVFMCVVLYFFNVIATSRILWAVGAGSLASSSFLVFGRPSSEASKPLKIIGGFIIGILAGEIIRFIASYFFKFQGPWLSAGDFHIIGMLASISVGFCLVLMSLFNCEHPPAAGMSMVLVIDVHDYRVLGIIFSAAIVLALFRVILKKYLRDLH